MAHYVALEYEGSTIDLTTGDNMLGQYSIRPARMGENGAYEPVQERVRVHVNGTSAADLQSNIHAIEQWLSTTAERKAVGEGSKLYLLVRPDGYSDTYRTELFDAVFVPEADTLELWANLLVTGHIEFTRSPYFEGPRTQLSLANRWGSGTQAITIDNRNDATHDAFVTISAGQVKGTVPAPLELHVQNKELDVGGVGWDTHFIGIDARSGPTTLEPVLEGEAQTDGGGTTAASSGASSGNVWRSASTAANSHIYPKWTIPSAWSEAFRGRFVRVLVRTYSANYPWVYQAKIKDYYGIVDLFVGRPRQGKNGYSGFLDLGTVPIPPIAYSTDLAELKLEIELYHTGAANTQVDIDYILLMPTDSGRTLIQTGMNIPQDDWVIFDEIEQVWVSNEADLKHPIYTPRGPGLMIFPDVANRIWIVTEGFGVGTDETKAVQAYYRPRRLTL